jgi:hypothetical protein
MKNFFLSILLALVTFTSFAETISGSSATNSITSLSTNGIAIYKLMIANGTGSASTVAFYDTSATNLTYTLGQYTNTTQYTTNLVTTYTNYLGVIQTNTNTFLYTLNTTQTASTNNYRRLATIVVPAGNTVTYSPTTPLAALLGLTVTNDAAVSVTVDYAPLK